MPQAPSAHKRPSIGARHGGRRDDRRDQDKEAKRLYRSKRWALLRREVFLRDGYTCQMCGRLCTGIGPRDPLSPECDHIIPHKGDHALMWDVSNLQTLHKSCHSVKTATEDGGLTSGAQTHPNWLPKPACPVTIVCGPAGAGKTTWAKGQASPLDVVIDLDECFRVVCGTHGHTADRKHLSSAIRLRNKLIAELTRKTRGQAFLIVSAPTERERKWWANKLDAQVVLLAPSVGEIASRNVGERRVRLAEDWYADAAADAWTPRKKNVAEGYW